MIKNLFTALVLFSATASFAANLVCKSDVDSKTERVVLINDSVIMICQASKGTNFNDPSIRPRVCAAAMSLVTSSGTVNGAIQSSHQTISSALNNMTTDLVFTVNYSKNTNNKFSTTIEIGTTNGVITGSDVTISKSLNILMNKKNTLQNCSLI